MAGAFEIPSPVVSPQRFFRSTSGWRMAVSSSLVCGFAFMFGGCGGIASLGGTPGLDNMLSFQLFGKTFEFMGSGRTDAGVHALMQVAHLEIHSTLPTEALRRRMNDELPPDINILDVAKAPHRFHARHAAVARSYLYQISRRRTAFAKPYVWWIKEPLDLDRMREERGATRLLDRVDNDIDFEDALAKWHDALVAILQDTVAA